ncbi:MAG: M28 family peptidase [Acidobacteriota bacterium]|nr:M28 family peptidase [Acidobacteriota bacterium]
MLKRFVLILVLITSLVAPLPAVYSQRSSTAAATKTAPSSSLATSRKLADQITAAQLKDYLYFIASDEMEGRDTPSRGLDTVAKFIALNLSRWGLKPAGDNGTYFQRIALQRLRLDPSATRMEINGQAFNFGDDLLAAPVAGTASSAPLVFVGHGWVVKAKNIDAYQGIDVKDKIMVIAGGGLPAGVTFADIRGGKQGVDYITPDNYAETHGAKAIISIPDKRTLENWNRIRQNVSTAGAITVEKFQKPSETPHVPRVTISEKALNALMQGEKETAASLLNPDTAVNIKPFDFSADKRVTLTVGTKTEEVFTQNVVAKVEGSDPVLKNEYVALGAHYDHVGTGAPAGGRRADPKRPNDTIWNGADDDGSGTTALLALAETLGKNPPPKRSVLFVWHCGEEKGLWGSRYFTENPTIPLSQIITQINIDMIGRSRPAGDTNPDNDKLSGPNEIYIIGSKMMSTQLGELSENMNHAYLNLTLNYKYDDPKDPNRFFYRSDHFNYARKGIPIIFYFDGEHEDYHRPGDEPQKIDYQKLEKVTRTVFVTLWELANMPSRPVVDKPLPAEVTMN